MTIETSASREIIKDQESVFSRLIRLNGVLNISVTWSILILLLFFAITVDLLPLQSPTAVNALKILEPPSSDHWFGTDSYGMDVFSRTIYAIRVDFALAVSSVLIGMVLGVILGALAGFIGGIFDDIVTRFAEVIQSFPQILFGMAILALLGNNILNLILISSFYNIPVYARLVRSVISPLRESEYVLAARCSGRSTVSIVFWDIIPNAMVPVFSQFPLSCAWAIQIVAGLSFIGLGVRVPTPEWGSMINLGSGYIVFGKWWPSVFPGFGIVISVWVLSNLSDQIKSLYMERI
jgi:peptide/nickel transport system permease protein